MKLSDSVDALLRPVIKALGYELDEVEYSKEYGNWVLTLYIEREDGTSADLDDCEKVSRAVDPVLDEADPIEQEYYLSVSSIGLDRPIKKDKDFQRNLGEMVTVKLYAPMDGKKEYIGRLTAFNGEAFTIFAEGKERVIGRRDAADIRPHIDFDGLDKQD